MKIKLSSYITGNFQIKKKENKKPELSNSEIIYLIEFPSYVTQFFHFYLFILKFPSYEKLAMTSQFGLTRFYNSGIPDPKVRKTQFLKDFYLFRFI